MTRVEWRGMHMEYATRGRFGGLGLKTIVGRFHGFGPQHPGGGSEEERMARGGIEEFASRQSYLMKGAVAVGRRIPMDHNSLGLNGLTQNI